jgi:hypothetical protein
MPTKNNKRLESINQKIADLQKLQKKIEDDYISNLSKDITKMLFKKKAYDVDKSALLKIIENAVDDFVQMENKVPNKKILD